MSSCNKTLQLIASKLGLADEEKVLNKAAEFLRLLQTKPMAGTNLTDTSRIVICLDLAANFMGMGVDIKSAMKYAGLKPLLYSNSRKFVENLLELNSDKLTTNMLCAALHCSGVEELAEKVLEEFKKQSKMDLDLNLPQYVCMAVYQACRLNKVKISKSKLIEKSRLKPMQWTKLDGEWTKFVDEKFAAMKPKKGRSAKNKVIEDEEENMDVDLAEKQKEESTDTQIESYVDWKRRMLEMAYQELKELQEKDIQRNKETPRRSPRKTPQKFSPYNSPIKERGVRLLFPTL